MSGDCVDLWQFSLDGGSGSVNAALAILCPHERAQFQRFGNPRLATAFATRRAARRIILAKYLDIEPSEVMISEAPSGKPVLSGPSPGLHFNASHSKDCGILAVSARHPVGADIECPRRICSNALAARILSPSERIEVGELAPDDFDAGVLRIWAGKEALVKGIGVALDLRDLPRINLPVAPAPAAWRQVGLEGRMKVHGRWHVYYPSVSDGCFTCLAAPFEARVTISDARGLLAGKGIEPPEPLAPRHSP